MTDPGSAAETRDWGLVAEYVSPGALVEAARRLSAAEFRCWDAYTPFPVPELDPLLRIRPSRLAWLGLGGGLVGALAGALLQTWTNGIAYPWLVSNKPLFSLPESVPIVFALSVLGASLAALVGLLLGGPYLQYAHPLDELEGFFRATDDRFFLFVETRDPRYEESLVRQLIEPTEPLRIEPLRVRAQVPANLPRPLLYGLIALVLGLLLPFPLLAVARQSKSGEPRFHLMSDMDQQAPLRAQAESGFWPDRRSLRKPPAGTVAWGDLAEDDHLERGRVQGEWARVLPSQIAINRDTMLRGRDRYDVYCASCHGLVGNGDGFASKRAEELGEGTWVPATNLNQEALRRQPVGQLYGTISDGVRTMAGLGTLLAPRDRWAVVLYLRALQRSRHATLADLSPEERDSLE